MENVMVETVIVVCVIAAALYYTVRRLILSRKGGCGCGCGGCDCGGPPAGGGCPGCSHDDKVR